MSRLHEEEKKEAKSLALSPSRAHQFRNHFDQLQRGEREEFIFLGKNLFQIIPLVSWWEVLRVDKLNFFFVLNARRFLLIQSR